MGSIARERQRQWADASVFKQVKQHERQWAGCQACPLHEDRCNVVLWRGHLPADIVFIGEAPGESEDVIGVPFVGPAGRCLDEIIEEAFAELPASQSRGLRFAMTNAVACKPVDENGISHGMTRKPKAAEMKECSPRLNALLKIANPALIVLVGKVAKTATKDLDGRIAEIVHPASLLRMDEGQYALGFKRAVKTIAAAIDRHISSRKDR